MSRLWLFVIIPVGIILSWLVAVFLLWIFSIIPWWGVFSTFFIIALVVLWVAVIYDLLRRADVAVWQVALWIAAIVLVRFLGALAYYLTRPAPGKIRYRGEQIA